MTAVLASVQSVDRTPLGLYALVVFAVYLAVAVYCVLGVVTVARLSAWRQRRNARRVQR